MELIDNGKCIICGKDNPDGFKLTFIYDPAARTAVSKVVIPEKYIGWQHAVHGGVTSMLLDEVMAHAAMSNGKFCVTAEMKIRFKKPVLTNVEYELFGELVSEKGRIMISRGFLRKDGQIYAEGEARLLVPVR